MKTSVALKVSSRCRKHARQATVSLACGTTGFPAKGDVTAIRAIDLVRLPSEQPAVIIRFTQQTVFTNVVSLLKRRSSRPHA